MKDFYRGAGVHISVLFRDRTGAPVTPSSATVTLSYAPKGSAPCDRSFYSFAMSPNPSGAGDWIYDWDSSPAGAGIVYGTAMTADQPTSKVDFEFRLVANRANKELAGDDWMGTGGY